MEPTDPLERMRWSVMKKCEASTGMAAEKEHEQEHEEEEEQEEQEEEDGLPDVVVACQRRKTCGAGTGRGPRSVVDTRMTMKKKY